ncbi:hypothetical protein CC1G_09078 [Coprinopsis cinerea okayama7|uniref:Ricin B lectin domain-containing protein n=1 Tax=Coprinopsis cinerea (strain Okayama-7 / 130 / ATCC MYA-4618 / FGSC 9003) TaxID=240176 RepID=A8P319_COPC7|nr:hypothetical protein CC1G_09078 [Coprinopsis cinerea okayama7\|eukprot:XP_001838450.2 hypothetical protein CC1G_09078 [Coprinopsis cinerea okayama7\
MRFLLKCLPTFALLGGALTQNTFSARIRNNCGNTMRLFIDGVDTGPLLPGGDHFANLGLDTVIYNTLNGGNPDGSATTRVFFWGERFYYYIVKDAGVSNVGVSISVPEHPKSVDGLCTTITCEPATCSSSEAYSEKQAFTENAIPVSSSPALPLRSCPFGGARYVVEWCPNGTMPPGWEQNGQEIQLVVPGDRIWCVDVRAAAFTPGTPVQLYRCNGTPAQKWLVPSPATTPGEVRLFGTDLCLDAGSNPHNGGLLTIQQCDGRPSQVWVYDDTNGRYTFSTIGGQCMDDTNGLKEDWVQLQTWGCGPPENPNQKWLASVAIAP